MALTCVTASISTGQAPPVQEWSIVTTVQIKPEFRVEYEGVQKEVSAVYKKANVPPFVHPERVLIIDTRGNVVMQDRGDQDQVVTARVRLDERIGKGAIRSRKPKLYGDLLK